jgi:hypothetical protein
MYFADMTATSFSNVWIGRAGCAQLSIAAYEGGWKRVVDGWVVENGGMGSGFAGMRDYEELRRRG